MKLVRVIAAVFALGCCGLPEGRAQTGDEWKSWLEKPLSPGSVAILVEHGADPDVQARWRAALKHEDPAVRAAAARAIYAAGQTGLLADVAAALTAETNAGAAREEARTFAALASTPVEAILLDVLKRWPEHRHLIATLLGRANGPGAVAHLSTLKGDSEDRMVAHTLVRAATSGSEDALTRLAIVALREQDLEVWRAILNARADGVPLSDGMIASALGATNAELRAITLWSLATQTDKETRFPETIEQALAEAPAAEADGDATPKTIAGHAAFAAELLARARGRKPREDLRWAGAVAERKALLPGSLYDVASVLTRGEQRVLVDAERLPPNIGDVAHAYRPLPAPDADATLSLTLADYPPGYALDLARIAGCRPEVRQEFRVQLPFDRLGRPRGLASTSPDVSAGCAKVVRTLFASSSLTTFPATRARGAMHTIAIRFLDARELDCSERLEKHIPGSRVRNGGVVGGAVRVGGKIQEPRKVRDVKPLYPVLARRARIQGMVILEATINPCGYVRDLHVLRSIPGLDASAIQAVSQWEYTPTLLDDVPVPVIMTVTVNYTLSQ
jgi:TonB family protein